MPLSNQDASDVANIITPQFDEIVADYNFVKYPADVYEDFKSLFSLLNENNGLIENALVWKWGHWGKPNYPQHHRNLIAETEGNWSNYVNSDATDNSSDTFNWWRTSFNRRTTYITVAYITHLVHHQEPLPIIDQHNYRAMNSLKSVIRENFRHKKSPSIWADITMLKQFMQSILVHLPNYTFSDLDRFLMMYGRNHAPR